jgi:hypothetical protein
MQSKKFSEASKIRQIHFREAVERLLQLVRTTKHHCCGVVTGMVLVIGVVIKI